MKKQILASSLIAALAISPLSAIGPLTKTTVSAAEIDLSDFAKRVLHLQQYMEDDERQAVSDALENLRAIDKVSMLKDIVSGVTFDPSVTAEQKHLVANFIKNLGSIVYSSNKGELDTSLDGIRDQVKQIRAEFGIKLTEQEVIDFVQAMEKSLKESLSLTDIYKFSSSDTHQIIAEKTRISLEKLVPSSGETAFPQIREVLKKVFGDEYINSFTKIKQNLDKVADPYTDAEKAVIKALIRSEAKVIVGNNPVSAVTVKKSSSQEFKVEVLGYNVLGLSNLTFEVKNNGQISNDLAFNIKDNKATVKPSNDADTDTNYVVGLKYKTHLLAKFEVDVEPKSSSGGGGGGGNGGGGSTKPNPDYTVKESINADGQKVLTFKLKGDGKLLQQAKDSVKPIDLVLKLEGEADIYQLDLTPGFVKQLEKDNPDNTITMVTPHGSLTVTARELLKSLNDSKHSDGNALIHLIVKKGKTNVKAANEDGDTQDTEESLPPNKKFSDVNDQWFAADVQLLAHKSIISGRTETEFVPHGTLTRAEFATMVSRALGIEEDAVAGAAFQDVDSTEWFAGYVGASVKVGLIKGYTNGTFKPNVPVTREEAAVILVQAIEYTGNKVALTEEEKKAELAKFKDSNQVGSWALDSIAYVSKAGILKGNNGAIQPKSNSTRAESAALLTRFLESLNLISK